MKIKRLYEIEDVVRDILKEDRRARKDDFYLISVLIKRVRPSVLTMRVIDALNNAKAQGFPPFESITRARRKVQSADHSLKDAETDIARYNETSTYIQYAIEGGGKYAR